MERARVGDRGVREDLLDGAFLLCLHCRVLGDDLVIAVGLHCLRACHTGASLAHVGPRITGGRAGDGRRARRGAPGVGLVVESLAELRLDNQEIMTSREHGAEERVDVPGGPQCRTLPGRCGWTRGRQRGRRRRWASQWWWW